MVRNYKRGPQARSYRTKYNTEELDLAVNDVRIHGVSIREASRRYEVPFGTLFNKLKGKHTGSIGHPTALSRDEEAALVENIILVSSWGYPLALEDVRHLVKVYLDRSGRKSPLWKGNYPGKDWATKFVHRHPDLVQRNCQNITVKRASVSREDLQKYFNNLEQTLEGVPPQNIINFDETNLSDDPGRIKCLFKRGVKYPERVMNSSKTAISLMFAGTATGDLLPPYVVYRAEHLWSSWCLGGPKGTRYNVTKSGWFDANSFEDWFIKCVLPWAKKNEEPKVAIGDNLSSHFSVEVLRKCQEYNIRFACLPPNSTHMCQPLDVAFFAPMKRNWRKLLSTWKQTQAGRQSTLSKDRFPALLTKLMNAISDDAQKNLQSGFRKCGIHPFQPEEVLRRIPDKGGQAENHVPTNISESLVDMLKEMRDARLSQTPRNTRQKLKNKEPGKSLSENELTPATSGSGHLSLKRMQKKRKLLSSSSDSEDEDEATTAENEVVEDDGEVESSAAKLSGEESSDNSENELAVGEVKPTDFEDVSCSVGDWVIVKYTSQRERILHFIGQVISAEHEFFRIKFVQRKKQFFTWPMIDDVDTVSRADIILKLKKPALGRRGQMSFSLPDNLNFCSI